MKNHEKLYVYFLCHAIDLDNLETVTENCLPDAGICSVTIPRIPWRKIQRCHFLLCCPYYQKQDCRSCTALTSLALRYCSIFLTLTSFIALHGLLFFFELKNGAEKDKDALTTADVLLLLYVVCWSR